MNELAVVTGASGGIGLELARSAARDGYDVLMVAQESTRLKQAAKLLRADFGGEVETVAADLSTPEGVEAVAAAINGRAVAALVNNAGFATYGKFAELPLGKELAEIRLNVEALTHLTRLVVPGMVAVGKGRILNLGSVAAFYPGPLMSTYFATKAYVVSFSEGLAQELAGTGVTVTVLCPGPTSTGFAARANVQETKIFKSRLTTAVHVAAQGWHGMKAGKRVVVPSLASRWQIRLTRFVPRSWLARVMMKVQS